MDIAQELLDIGSKYGGTILAEEVLPCARSVSLHVNAEYKKVKALVVEELKEEFGIQSRDNVFVTDNGSNMVAAFKDYVRLSCAAHNINLVLKYVFDHLEEDNPTHSRVITLLKESKTLVSHFKRAGLQNELDETLKQAVETRWNSRLLMLESINNALKSGKLHKILLQRRELRFLNHIDSELLEEIIELLKSFDKATRELSTDKNPTLHLVLPTKATLLNNMEIQDEDSAIVKEVFAETSSCLCARPTLPANAEALGLQRFSNPGTELVLSCKAGHSPLLGPRSIVCSASGEWTKTRLICKPKRCPNPDDLSNGETYYEDTVYRSTINYTCLEGYTMHGASSAVCQANGTWSEPTPECKPVTCGLAPIPLLGKIVYDKKISGNTTEFGLKGTYECLPPFALRGNARGECTASGAWTAPPECRLVTCRPPQPIEHGYMSSSQQRDYDYKETVRYGCNGDYVIDGSPEIECQETGEWSEQPVCKASCRVGIGRGRILYNGRKLWIKELSPNRILHKDIVSVYCMDTARNCGYSVSTQCIDGNLKIPECFEVSEWSNGTAVERSWTEAEKWALVAVLGLEMVMGTVGNCLVLLVKVMCRGQFSCRYWLPFISLTLSDLGCSLLIISGSLLAMLTGGQRSPWCEVVSLLKFAFVTSSIGSIAILCVQRLLGEVSNGSGLFVVMATVCLASWVTGVVFGSVPVVYAWIRYLAEYDPAEMLCAVFWESSYSDMLVYILCAFSICIFLPLLLVLLCSSLTAAGCHRDANSDDEEDLSTVTPLLVAFYLLCYTPFAVSELILLGRLDLSPAPDWLRTLSSVMSYLDCGLNPLIYCSNPDFREAGLALLWTNRKPFSDPVLTAVTKLDL
ncbi:uncharacterized protein ACN63O_011008 [Diretmus argenteus]